MRIMQNHKEAMNKLARWFKSYDSAIIAFSSGVDSSLLAACAKNELGQRAYAVTSVSPSFSEVEKVAARRIAEEIGIELTVVNQDDLAMEDYVKNDVSRCYFCRNNLALAIAPIAKKLGVSVCVDGTHCDDLNTPRPGIKALRESGFKAPYVELGIGKETIRAAARYAGLSNWNRPSEACLSSRVAFGQRINLEKLKTIEEAEALVRNETHAKIVRVRTIGDNASVEVDNESLATAKLKRLVIERGLRELGYSEVVIDPEGYSSGKMLQLFIKSDD